MISDLSLHNDNVRNKIRSLWLEGKMIKEIQAELGISAGTWDTYLWRNDKGFRDFIMEVKKQEMLLGAEKISREIREVETKDEKGKHNAKLLAIKQKEAEFLRETLGKDLGYTKRSEVIGVNLVKTEPLDEEQKGKLDKLLGKEVKEVNISTDLSTE